MLLIILFEMGQEFLLYDSFSPAIFDQTKTCPGHPGLMSTSANRIKIKIFMIICNVE